MPLVIPPSLLDGRVGGRSSMVVSSSSSSGSSSSGLIKTLAVGVTGYCAAWGVYYLVQDTIRNSTISKRKRRFDNRVRRSSSKPSQDVSKEERKAAVIERFASLSVLGRYVNPFGEWREQGAWEYVAWKSWVLFLQGRLWYDGGLKKLKKTKEGRARIEQVLPVRQPDWEKYPQTTSSRSTAEEEDWQRMSKSDLEGEGGALSRLPSEDGKIRYTWVGQSTFLITYAGMTILTDPVFEVQPVPTAWSPNRITDVPCTMQDIVSRVQLDIVLVSHNHFDHFDTRCVPHVPDTTTWIVPLGMRKLLRSSGVKNDHQIIELTWWEMKELELHETRLDIQSIPAIHWSGRGPFDVNQSLWTSFSLRITPSSSLPTAHIYFSGDTGYSATYYPHISSVLPSAPDLAFLPIGSYAPRWHMRPQHVSPADSVQIAEDIGAKKSVAMHWGTWLMSDEDWDEPPKLLRQALEARQSIDGKEKMSFETVELGATNELTVQ